MYHAVTISCFERLHKMHLIRLKKVKIFGFVDYVVSFTLCIGIEISKKIVKAKLVDIFLEEIGIDG